jgi:hypothetical protein
MDRISRSRNGKQKKRYETDLPPDTEQVAAAVCADGAGWWRGAAHYSYLAGSPVRTIIIFN